MSDRSRTLAAALSLWALASVLQALVLTIQEAMPFRFAVFGMALNFGTLGLLMVPVWFLARRLHHSPFAWWARGLAHVAMGLVVLVLWQSAGLYGLYQSGGQAALDDTLGTAGLWLLVQSALIYTVTVVGIVAVQTGRRLRRQRERSAELRLLARESEVRALRSQLRPHFLFNVLNSIYALIPSDTAKAQRMVELLSQLMRDTLELSDQTSISLAEEIELVERYLEVEALRFGDRLAVEIRCAPDTAQTPVPPFILQPLVENALKHGVGASGRGVRVSLTAQANGSATAITVEDDGPGADSPGGDGQGRGLEITRARLDGFYGEAATLIVGPGADCGWRVRLELPGALPADAP